MWTNELLLRFSVKLFMVSSYRILVWYYPLSITIFIDSVSWVARVCRRFRYRHDFWHSSICKLKSLTLHLNCDALLWSFGGEAIVEKTSVLFSVVTYPESAVHLWAEFIMLLSLDLSIISWTCNQRKQTRNTYTQFTKHIWLFSRDPYCQTFHE